LLAFSEGNSDTGSEKYNLGDKMRSKIEIDAEETDKLKSQYADAFPFPRSDSYGNCNNYGSAYFM
jgi:hypothetical protein